MNPKLLVKISNIIGIVAILALIYWVFTFALVNIFGLKIFRENLTETFVMSILGIIALMGGALMLNIMFNLTRIAEKNQEQATSKSTRPLIYGLIALFPIITVLAFTGDYLNAQQKQKILMQSAEKIVLDQQQNIKAIANYQFNAQYIQRTAHTIKLLERLDSAFKEVYVIVPEQIDGSKVYLGFNEYGVRTHSDSVSAEEAAMLAANAAASAIIVEDTNAENKKIILKKADYVHNLSLNNRQYLDQVFQNNLKQVKFEAYDGRYELFYPYQINGKTKVVLYFSDYQRYGKFGS